jgi:tRNA(Ser,Leu) C12 N-acetylase TAN1
MERKLESLNFEKNEEQTQMLEKIKQLEDEKNALLDYIEENIEKQSAGVISPMFNGNSAGGNTRIISSEVN